MYPHEIESIFTQEDAEIKSFVTKRERQMKALNANKKSTPAQPKSKKRKVEWKEEDARELIKSVMEYIEGKLGDKKDILKRFPSYTFDEITTFWKTIRDGIIDNDLVEAQNRLAHINVNENRNEFNTILSELDTYKKLLDFTF